MTIRLLDIAQKSFFFFLDFRDKKRSLGLSPMTNGICETYERPRKLWRQIFAARDAYPSGVEVKFLLAAPLSYQTSLQSSENKQSFASLNHQPSIIRLPNGRSNPNPSIAWSCLHMNMHETLPSLPQSICFIYRQQTKHEGNAFSSSRKSESSSAKKLMILVCAVMDVSVLSQCNMSQQRH